MLKSRPSPPVATPMPVIETIVWTASLMGAGRGFDHGLLVHLPQRQAGIPDLLELRKHRLVVKTPRLLRILAGKVAKSASRWRDRRGSRYRSRQ